MDDYEYSFSTRIKFLREFYELDRKEMADRLDTTVSSLCRYENDKMRPTLEVAKKISQEFDVSLDWLAGSGKLSDIKGGK